MSARWFILYWLLLASISLWGCKSFSRHPETEKWNIILLLADDMGWADLACYGNDFIETPNMDALARSGMRFTQGYASAPLCSPTRASILTGLSPTRLGMTEHIRGRPKPEPWMAVIAPPSADGLDTAYLCLPEMLAKAGYHSAHIGKWHLGWGVHHPRNQGFDFTFASDGHGLPRSFFYPFFETGAMPDLQAYAKEGDFLDDVLTSRSIDFIRENKDAPFYLQLSYYSPHVPIEAPANLVEKYRAKRGGLPDSLLPNVLYAAMVERIDYNVGRLMTALREMGLDRKTLVVFTSDNGGLSVREVPGYDHHTPPTDNGILRDGKGYLYEGGTRVPFIAALPERIRGGRTEDTPVISTDLFNTFADIAGLPTRTTDGLSLWPLLFSKPLPTRSMMWHLPHYSPQRARPVSAMRKSNYKLLYFYEGERIELYNLDKDPGETKDLTVAEPERAAQLKAELFERIAAENGKLPERNPGYKKE